MANEIDPAYIAGATLYAVVKTAAGAYALGVTPEAFDATHWPSYAVALAEYGSTGQYHGDFPALPAGAYRVEVYVRAGVSPAPSDGPPVAEGQMQWSGTAEVSLASRSSYAGADTAGTATLLGRLPAALAVDGSGRVDVGRWLGAAVPAPAVDGYPLVDAAYIDGAPFVDGVAGGGTATTVTLQAGMALGADVLRDRLITIVAGTGKGQSLRVASNTGADPVVCTMERPWAVTPSADSAYLVGAAVPSSNYALAPAGLDAVPADGAFNLRQAAALILSALAGRATGLDTGAVNFKGADGSTTRIAATTDAYGNRTAVTLTPPA